jgi:hypothetical protein
VTAAYLSLYGIDYSAPIRTVAEGLHTLTARPLVVPAAAADAAPHALRVVGVELQTYKEAGPLSQAGGKFGFARVVVLADSIPAAEAAHAELPSVEAALDAWLAEGAPAAFAFGAVMPQADDAAPRVVCRVRRVARPLLAAVAATKLVAAASDVGKALALLVTGCDALDASVAGPSPAAEAASFTAATRWGVRLPPAMLMVLRELHATTFPQPASGQAVRDFATAHGIAPAQDGDGAVLVLVD